MKIKDMIIIKGYKIVSNICLIVFCHTKISMCIPCEEMGRPSVDLSDIVVRVVLYHLFNVCLFGRKKCTCCNKVEPLECQD
jgi:hypothetical protein